MNNKASKRLLAASVASLMLVVAFCGFTYAGDDADAGEGTFGSPYVKNVVVAKYDADTDYDDGEKITFTIVTTQNVTNEGNGIVHESAWKKTLDSSPISNLVDNPTVGQKSKMSVVVTGNNSVFQVTGIARGVDTWSLVYELTSTVGGQHFKQQIYYNIVVTVVEALPNEGALSEKTGYVGVGLVLNAYDWGISSDIYELKFYANNLPKGLSMNVDGTISGVPKVSGTYAVDIYVYNGTGMVHSFELPLKIENHIASLDAYVTETADVKKVSDDRYVVVQGAGIYVVGNVTGYKEGAMTVTMDVGSAITTYDKNAGVGSTDAIYLNETGEKLIKVSYIFDMDGNDGLDSVTIVDYITVVIVDVVEDATTGIGLVAGSIPSS